MGDSAIRCGDHVHHGPTGEDWVVAYVDGAYLAWCGWPDGEAKLDDCTLIKACTDEEHIALLHQIASSSCGRRTRKAQAELAILACGQRSHATPDRSALPQSQAAR